MGKFINTKESININVNRPSIDIQSNTVHTSVIDSKSNSGSDRTNLIQTFTNSAIKKITDNPFYFFINMSRTVVTFYNIDKDYTTLDEIVDNTYNFIGPASGLRFDKINNCILYGIQRIELNIDMTDFGTETSDIEGEAYLPPNTFTPYQNSYFSIDYLNSNNKEALFRVTGVSMDTFPNNQNFWKISYKLESIGEDITPQIVKEYQYLSNNVGKGNVLVSADDYDLTNQINHYINMLKDFYNELYFQPSTQTFVFKYGLFDNYFYDPYLIHFLMNTGIFSTNDERYVHVCQPAIEPLMMRIDYKHTIWYKLEYPNSNYLCYYIGYGILVRDPMSLLVQRMEPYYMVTLRDDQGDPIASPTLEPIPVISSKLLELIGYDPDESTNTCTCKTCLCNNSILNELSTNQQYYKLIYDYINGISISLDTIKNGIDNIRFVPCKELYYAIPMLIYILNQRLNSINGSDSDKDNQNLLNTGYTNGANYLGSCNKGCIEK